jgi:O-antigen ligase
MHLATSIVAPILLVLALLWALPAIASRLRFDVVLVAFGLLTPYVFALVFPGVARDLAWSAMPQFLGGGLALFLLAALIRDYGVLWTWLIRLSGVAVVLNTVLLLVGSYRNITYAWSDHLSLAYGLLPFALFLVEDSLRRTSLVSVSLLALGLFGLVSYGTRGPVVIAIAYLFIRAVAIVGLNRRFVLPAIAITALIGAVVLVTPSFTARLIQVSGMSTRVLNAVETGDVLDPNGRDSVWGDSLDAIGKNPFGVGPFGDRVALMKESGMDHFDADAASGRYPHNLFLELLLQWGILPGAALIFAFLLVTVLCFRRLELNSYVAWALMASGVLPLMVSISYLIHQPFFLFLGLCMGAAARRS